MQTTFSSTKRSSSISINFIVPQGWHELSDKQLRYVYQLIADGYSTEEVKTLCLLQWSGTKVISKQVTDKVASQSEETGAYLLKKGKTFFEITLPYLDLTLYTVMDYISRRVYRWVCVIYLRI